MFELLSLGFALLASVAIPLLFGDSTARTLPPTVGRSYLR